MLGEQVILLECPPDTLIEVVHQTTSAIEVGLGKLLTDIVPAYHSIALFASKEPQQVIDQLTTVDVPDKEVSTKDAVKQMPICYEEGLDLERIAQHAALSIEEVIERHLNGVYRSLFIGFTPGFIYADGLDPSLACPRLAHPRNRIPEGSIGIAGEQTGIYSMSSPGGWNIIGRTPTHIFDPSRLDPMMIHVGDRYRFYRISQKEFVEWER